MYPSLIISSSYINAIEANIQNPYKVSFIGIYTSITVSVRKSSILVIKAGVIAISKSDSFLLRKYVRKN